MAPTPRMPILIWLLLLEGCIKRLAKPQRPGPARAVRGRRTQRVAGWLLCTWTALPRRRRPLVSSSPGGLRRCRRSCGAWTPAPVRAELAAALDDAERGGPCALGRVVLPCL